MAKKRNLKMWVVMAVLLVGMAPAIAAGEVIYVDADASPGGDGSSWATAYKYLQDALYKPPTSGDEIWVAVGTYKPDEDEGGNVTPGSRTATFQLINGVAIYGGFPSGGGQWEDRDPNAYETILSGDLNGNDVGGFWDSSRNENSYHVVTGNWTDETAVLDGFTITAGNNPLFPNSGGGMYNYKGSPTLTNCTFSDNSADYNGGGMCNWNYSSPTLTNCTFSGNFAHDGGGMYNRSSSSPTLTNCTFTDNSASDSGGGMFNLWNSSPMVTNCTFSGNSARTSGGGMWNNNYSSPMLTNCTFSGNWSYQGGGMSTNVGSNPTVTNCSFSGNSAGKWGGGMWNYKSSPTLTNCTFSGNSADNYGGGMYNFDSSPTLSNCILWGDTPQEVYGGGAVITYSDVQGGWAGDGNIDGDPLFVGPGVGDLRLLPASPCIDAGDNTAVPAGVTTDLDGHLRFVDQPDVPDTGNGTAPIVDMGAYEANYIEVAMKFTPQALNPGSQGNWVKAHFVLPDGFDVNDVDANTPAVIAPLGIESEYMNAFINEDELVEIEAAFSRSDFCGSATSDADTEVIVIGLLTSGQNFYGTDTIKIINKTFEYLGVLASHWLEGGCGAPDWCGGGDLDHSSAVDFLDFALFDGCCIEVIRQ